MSFHNDAMSRHCLKKAVGLCKESISSFEAQDRDDRCEMLLIAYSDLGDLCKLSAKNEQGSNVIAQLVSEGTKAYETAIRAMKGAVGLTDEGCQWYNMACLALLRLAAGCSVSFSEQKVAELLS